MKYVGLLLVAATGLGLGLYAARRLQRRVTLLRQLERVMETLLRLLTYSALPMGELWLQLAENESHRRCPLVADTAAALAETSFSEAFRMAVERNAEAGLLEAPERQLLLEFGAESGRYDLSRQADQLRGCLCGLRELSAAAAADAAARGRIYRVMGAAGGSALALLLL